MSNQLLALLSAVLVAAIPVVRAWVLTKLTPTRLQHISSIAHIAVNAAEKLGVSTGATNEQKLDYAAEVVSAGAKRLGVKLSQDEVLAFVHDALRTMQRYETQQAQVGIAPNF